MNDCKSIYLNTLDSKQNFQGEVISGFIMQLIKETLENIRLGKQTKQQQGNNYGKQSSISIR